jgi:hypothetical protein
MNALRQLGLIDYCSLFPVRRFELAFRPPFGKSLASSPSRKIPTRIAISVMSTVVLVIQIPVLSTGRSLLWREQGIGDRD